MLMKTMQQLVEKVEQLQTRTTGAAPKRDLDKEQICWECGKGGGAISDGIALIKIILSDQMAQGNGQGPQQ